MVNLGLTKVDDALVAKHPVGFVFVFMRFYYLCTLEDTVPLHTWNKPAAAHIDTTEMCNTGVAGFFAIQKALQRKLPYPLQWNLLISIVASSVGSYAVTRWETQKCSDLWLLLETGKVPDRSSPPVPQQEEPTAPQKTKYGDVME
uniref:Transmembrane protein 141 n=1 Tax=Astatotilapia calliptera TaxID=8154 RepID=A0AAX7UGU9_ASTCA